MAQEHCHRCKAALARTVSKQRRLETASMHLADQLDGLNGLVRLDATLRRGQRLSFIQPLPPSPPTLATLPRTRSPAPVTLVPRP